MDFRPKSTRIEENKTETVIEMSSFQIFPPLPPPLRQQREKSETMVANNQDGHTQTSNGNDFSENHRSSIPGENGDRYRSTLASILRGALDLEVSPPGFNSPAADPVLGSSNLRGTDQYQDYLQQESRAERFSNDAFLREQRMLYDLQRSADTAGYFNNLTTSQRPSYSLAVGTGRPSANSSNVSSPARRSTTSVLESEYQLLSPCGSNTPIATMGQDHENPYIQEAPFPYRYVSRAEKRCVSAATQTESKFFKELQANDWGFGTIKGSYQVWFMPDYTNYADFLRSVNSFLSPHGGSGGGAGNYRDPYRDLNGGDRYRSNHNAGYQYQGGNNAPSNNQYSGPPGFAQQRPLNGDSNGNGSFYSDSASMRGNPFSPNESLDLSRTSSDGSLFQLERQLQDNLSFSGAQNGTNRTDYGYDGAISTNSNDHSWNRGSNEAVLMMIPSQRPTSSSNLADSPRSSNASQKKKVRFEDCQSPAPELHWKGLLLPNDSSKPRYSEKIFVGGLSFRMSRPDIIEGFQKFGVVDVSWCSPCSRDSFNGSDKIHGCAYVTLQSKEQVEMLLRSCKPWVSQIKYWKGQQTWQYEMRYRDRDRSHKLAVEIFLWDTLQSTYGREFNRDGRGTYNIFLGNLHARFSANDIANFFKEQGFDDVKCIRIGTDKYDYPAGFARVSFGTFSSFMKAVKAKRLVVETPDFSRTLQIEPFIDKNPCSICANSSAAMFCKNDDCNKYYCHPCFSSFHSENNLGYHAGDDVVKRTNTRLRAKNFNGPYQH